MQKFVNREEELQLIEQQFDVLTEKNNLMRTRIIEFYGVGGIGKTTMLRKIEQNCQDKQVSTIWIDASQHMSDFSREIINQVQRYNVQFRTESTDWLDQSIVATRALLTKGPVILLIDSLDAADEEQLSQIEYILVDLAKHDKFFTILASKRIVSFDNSLSIARRLTPFPLKSFDRDSCIAFLADLEHHIESEICDTIFEWTGGYPLAINVMVQAIRDHNLDPRLENDKRQLLSIVVEEVISRGVLANVAQTPDELAWYQTILSLFSIPRRCNLAVMQRMIERFAPRYKLGSSLAYMSLQPRINQATQVLNWDPSKAGFSVEPPIRHIFLMRMKIEEHDKYTAIHRFMASECRRLADEVSGSDRARYLHEYLYHSANCEEGRILQQTAERIMRYIIVEPSEYFIQFHENFRKDEDLQRSLGEHVKIVLSHIYKHRSLINKQIASEVPTTERYYYLREYLYYVIVDPIEPNIVTHLKAHIQQIIAEEPIETCAKLYEELSQDTSVKEKLGAEIVALSALLPS